MLARVAERERTDDVYNELTDAAERGDSAEVLRLWRKLDALLCTGHGLPEAWLGEDDEEDEDFDDDEDEDFDEEDAAPREADD